MQHVSEKNRTPPLAFAASFSFFCSLGEAEQMPSTPNDSVSAAVPALLPKLILAPFFSAGQSKVMALAGLGNDDSTLMTWTEKVVSWLSSPD